ncbi:MAG TPA: alginate lyase family protein [Planctomycetota bacterium]|nr:alginate lyase family protein [Planctomycetota bacterium]
MSETPEPGSIARGARFLRSVRHTRPAQLAHRARLIAKRRALERAGASLPWRARPLAERGPAMHPEPPRPSFAPRRDLVEQRGGELWLRCAGRRLRFTLPLEWRPAGWDQGTRLSLLHLHYMEWLEALDDDACRRAILDWIEGNPPYGRGYWLDAWNAYALSIRCVVWMQQLAARDALRASPAVETILRSLSSQLAFLERNLELDIGGNHLIKDSKALAWGGRFFTGPEAERWSARGAELLARELGEQVLADGMHFERSPAYHDQVLADLLECRTVLPPGALRERLDEKLDSMARVSAELAHPDGFTSLFNDGGLHMARTPRDVLALYGRLRSRDPEPRPHVLLPEAGYFGLRGEDSFLLADCGAIAPDHLPAHGHADMLSFEWSTGGRRVIVDPGVATYDPGGDRARSRSAHSHNTLTVGDAEPCELYASFRAGRRARTRLERCEAFGPALAIEGSHDGFERLRGRPRVHRRLIAGRRGLHVFDHVTGGAGQPVRSQLLLHPEAEVSRGRGELRIRLGELSLHLETRCGIEIADAVWSPDIGVRLPTLQLVLSYGHAPCLGAFSIAALSPAFSRRSRALAHSAG